MNMNHHYHYTILQNLAHKAMIEHGLFPDFSAEVRTELYGIQATTATESGESALDLTGLLWASVDNDDSHDLDQLTVAEAMPDGKVKVLVAIADVGTFVRHDSAVDTHAYHNTTSVYTAAKIFPMLPEELSNDLTSLNVNVERLAVIIEMVIKVDGNLLDSAVYRARVRNHAQLAYNSVAAWLEGGDAPDALIAVKGLAENLRLQDNAAQKMRKLRYVHGALSLETVEARPTFDGELIFDLEVEKRNRATEMIEDFMIAANVVTTRYLTSRKFPSIRRIVCAPKRWARIVELAAEHKFALPAISSSKALNAFLIQAKAADPLEFPDLSLTIIKLLGAGVYMAELSGDTTYGHFGLAVKDYGHSTAPNRRYPDLITQRLVKAAIAGDAWPYSMDELDALAKHCTLKEDAANKVERQVGKSVAALLLETRIGERFNAIVTGASGKGTWVRVLSVPVEGKLVSGYAGLDVGDRVRVLLTAVNVERGFIDFKH